MPADHIRKAKKSKSKFGVDDRVEVKIKSKWVKGRVKRTHKDGTLDVDASNGEKARRVDASDVRARDDGSDGDDAKIGVGDQVRAKYKGRAKEYDGVIKLHSDGTFDRIKSAAVHKANSRGSSAKLSTMASIHRRDASSMAWQRGLSPIDSEHPTYLKSDSASMTTARSRPTSTRSSSR